MKQKFVLRILGEHNELLGWAEVYAAPRPQERGTSCPFFATGPTQVLIEQAGLASRVSIHWCDLDVARIQDILEPVEVSAGILVNYTWIEPVWLVPGMRDVPLPAVTVRSSQKIDVPVGALNPRL